MAVHSYYLVDRGDFSFQDTVEPVYSDTTRDQGNMSDFLGCRNTHAGYMLLNRKTLGP